MTKQTDDLHHQGDNWLRRAADSIEEAPVLKVGLMLTVGLLFSILSSLIR